MFLQILLKAAKIEISAAGQACHACPTAAVDGWQAIALTAAEPAQGRVLLRTAER